MRSPSVSVVIPCYNAAQTVSEAIASVTAQTMGDFEIVAVDNNSRDHTRETLAAIAADEPRLRVIEHFTPGASAARNAGIRAALGEFIAFLDADDLLDATYLEKHLQNLANQETDISYARIRRIDADGRPTGFSTQPKPTVNAVELLRSNPCTVMVVVRASVFQSVGLFDETLGAAEDQEFLFRAAINGSHLKGINEVLASYRITPGGLSADLASMLRNHDKLLSVAAEIAPRLVEQHRRTANAAMLRYCARRAIEQQEPPAVCRRYLARMYSAAPELLLCEPGSTIKVTIRVLLAQLSGASNWVKGVARAPKEV